MILPTLYVVCACLIIYSVLYTYIKLILYINKILDREISICKSFIFSFIIILYCLKLHRMLNVDIYSVFYTSYIWNKTADR